MNFEITVRENLLLKLRHKEDAADFFNLTDKNREHLRTWLPWVDATLTKEDTENFIDKCEKGFAEKKTMDLGIWFEGAWVGSMGFIKIDTKNAWAEIGYWLDKDYEGKGIMTSCVEKVISHGFTELTLHRIQIKCDSKNDKSRKIPERLGFTHEGSLRENRIRDGIFSDEITYGLLEKEWKEKISKE